KSCLFHRLLFLKLENYSTFKQTNFGEPYKQFIKSIINGIRNEPFVCYGAYVTEVQIVETPVVSGKERFVVASPVFIKRKMEKKDLHVTFDDKNSTQYLTEALQNKLIAAGLP